MKTSVVVEPIRSEFWREAARCRGMSSSLFFPPEEDGADAADAKQLCSECPVIEQCLESALTGDEQYGIWGATTPRERRSLRRQRRKIA